MAEVRNNTENKVVEYLDKKGILSFVPVLKTVDISGDKPKVISTPVSPGVIYIHCTEQQRLDILHCGLNIRRFVGNGTGGPKIIADSDIAEYIHQQLDIRSEAA